MWAYRPLPPSKKKIRVQKSAGKVLASIFWDQDGILFIDYLPKGQTINAEYYSSLLVQLKDILQEKRRGIVTKGVLLPPAPWTENSIEGSPFFVRRGGHCCRGDLVRRTTFWIFFFWVACKSQSNGLRSVLSFVGSMLNKSRAWLLQLVSFLVGLRIYQHSLICLQKKKAGTFSALLRPSVSTLPGGRIRSHFLI